MVESPGVEWHMLRQGKTSVGMDESGTFTGDGLSLQRSMSGRDCHHAVGASHRVVADASAPGSTLALSNAGRTRRVLQAASSGCLEHRRADESAASRSSPAWMGMRFQERVQGRGCTAIAQQEWMEALAESAPRHVVVAAGDALAQGRLPCRRATSGAVGAPRQPPLRLALADLQSRVLPQTRFPLPPLWGRSDRLPPGAPCSPRPVRPRSAATRAGPAWGWRSSRWQAARSLTIRGAYPQLPRRDPSVRKP
jgi:hypothetical protein